MQDFAAIDFELANKEKTSICSIGLVVVRNGQIADTFYSLVKPFPNLYPWFYTRVHGINRKMTADAPLFPEVWKQIAPKIEGLPLVAHDKHIDELHLRAVFQLHGMEYPGYKFYDTLEPSRKAFPDLPNHKLCTVAARCGYKLTPEHNALWDAMACAWIAREIL